MLVQALAEYADTYLGDQLADPAFTSERVGYVIEIFEDGSFARIGRRVREVTRGKRAVSEDLPALVPRSPVNRNSVVYPLPGCDAVQYLVGPGAPWTKAGEEQKQLRQHEAFRAAVDEVTAAVATPAWNATKVFLRRPEEVLKANQALVLEKIRAGSRVTVAAVPRGVAQESPGLLVEDEAFRTWWRQRFHRDSRGRLDPERSTMCLVSGVVGPVPDTHSPIKGLGYGQPSGVMLMSFDKPAFCSYGWKKNENSPVSEDRANAYVLALNDLLKRGEHRRGVRAETLVSTRYDVAGTTFIFWTSKPTDDDWGALLRAADDQSVRALFASVQAGREIHVADTSSFFMAAVGANGGRLVVRHWLRESVDEIRTRLAAWFAALRVADVFQGGKVRDGFSLLQLLLATERPGVKAEDVPGLLAIELVRRAFEGTPLGHAHLASLLQRLRHSHGSSRLAPQRMALIRMCVNDLSTRNQTGATPMPEELDKGLTHPAYLCGRLLATFDGLQYQAHDEDVNASVVDRYYALASTNPVVAFPKIEQLAQHHLKKLRRKNPGAAWAIGKQLADLHEGIARDAGARFPGQLSLEDQGRFAIGFHHQKAMDQARIVAAKAGRAEQTPNQ